MDRATAVRAILSADPARLRMLSLVRSLCLPDCWLGAGFLRDAVWDHLHGRQPASPSGDVDVIWFDPDRSDPAYDREAEARLRTLDPSIAWSVKNQGRMHRRNGDAPYTSAVDAMRYWPETATAVAARESRWGSVEFAAPFGFADLFALVVSPIPGFRAAKRSICMARIREKGWLERWPLLRTDWRQP